MRADDADEERFGSGFAAGCCARGKRREIT